MMSSNSLALIFLLASIAANTAAQSGTATTTLPTLVLPSPTSIGNASNILTYPLCAQICANETQPGCNPNLIDCACGAVYRSETAACEEVTCGEADYNRTVILAQQLCGPLYANNSILSSSVAAAIASATSVAAAAVSGKDVTNPASYPQCAQNCFNQLGFFECGGLSNSSCLCTSVAFNNAIGGCESANCSQSDITIITDLADVLCAPVGGLHPTESISTASPTVTPFQGTAASMVPIRFDIFCFVLVGLLGSAVVLL